MAKIRAKRGLVVIRDSEDNNLSVSKSGVPRDLILESDISLGISNDYQSLLSGTIGGSMSFFSSLSGGIVPAGFRQQGFQIWKSSNPIELKLSVSLHMVTSGRTDVVEPAMSLMAFSVPTLKDNGWGLVPPGASIVAILGEKAQDLAKDYNISEGKGYVSIAIGSYLNLKKCIIKNVIPTYSLQEDSEGNPISCKLDIDISTLDVVNDTMIRDLTV